MALKEDKLYFCARYLAENGIDAGQFVSMVDEVKDKPITEFAFVRQDDDFFNKVAVGLRELWPSGLKDNKYPWRESVRVLVDRLKFIWKDLEVSDDYSVDDCLEAGRKYLARFENNSTKYMQILKYFVFKQKTAGVDKKNGMYKVTYESTLVKLLQEKSSDEFIESMLEGEII